jgi:hypothetical protein
MPYDLLPAQPRGSADVQPSDGPQDVPQQPGTVVDSEVPDDHDPSDERDEEAIDGDG